jgi:tRNA-2-methylthio-N6-dimethylallyladenosine synthase
MNEGIKYYIHTYGCQMNQSDSQIVSTVLSNNGYQKAQTAEEA